MRKFIAVTGVAGLNKDEVIDFIVSNFTNITHIKHFDDLYFENQIWSLLDRKKRTMSTASAVSNIDFPMCEVEKLKNKETIIIALVDIRTKERLANKYKDQLIQFIVKPKSYEEFNKWINEKLDVMPDESGKKVLSECHPDYAKKSDESNDNGITIIFERQHDQPLSDDEKEEICKLIAPHLS